MSDNLFKASSVIKGSEKRVIDSNDIVSERIRFLSEILESQASSEADDDFVDGFVEGLDAIQVEQLLEDNPDGETPELVREVPQVNAQQIIDEANAEAEAIIANAQTQAEDIINSAVSEAENIKSNAYNEGSNSGYEAGYQEGLLKTQAIEAELNEKSQAMDAEYAKSIEELEPKFIELLTDIYSHVLGVELPGNTDVITFLLKNAIHNIDGSRNFFVHVSKDDYAKVSEAKDDLAAGLGSNILLEVIEDMTLKSSECFIEAESGIFDCSLGVELELLKKELILLSYQREN